MKYRNLSNARLGSRRLEKKLFLSFVGTKLIEITIKILSQLKNFNNVYFATYENK